MEKVNNDKIKCLIIWESGDIVEVHMNDKEVANKVCNGHNVIRLNSNEFEYADYHYSGEGKIIVEWKKPNKLED